MRTQRLELGRDVIMTDERGDRVRLEGRVRLAPGQHIDIAGPSPRGGVADVRSAVVLSWSVARLSETGTQYQGVCRIER